MPPAITHGGGKGRFSSTSASLEQGTAPALDDTLETDTHRDTEKPGGRIVTMALHTFVRLQARHPGGMPPGRPPSSWSCSGSRQATCGNG